MSVTVLGINIHAHDSSAALDHAGIDFADLDGVAFGWDRPAHAERLLVTPDPESPGWRSRLP